MIGIDFETASDLDLSEVGATKYASHPSTRILCLGYANETRSCAGVWRPGQPFPFGETTIKLQTFVAHNAQFDRQIWKHCLPKLPLPSRWLCTATRASVNGLPRGLDECSEALFGKGTGKDKDGEKSLKLIMRPDKKTGLWLRDTNPAEHEFHLLKTEVYCLVDIDRMWKVFDHTKPISEWEQEYYEFDQRLNERGFAVNRKQVERLLERLNEAYAELALRLHDASNGDLSNANSLKSVGAWLARKGLDYLPNFTAPVLTDVLERKDLADDVREVIKIRKLTSMKSPSKFASFKQRGCEEGDLLIMRDTYVVNGAHTGRHTSKGFQSQNLKRDSASELDLDILLNEPLDVVRLLVGEPLELAGKCVRPMVTARPGKKLLIGDFSKIETCVLFALARETRGLQMLRDGTDLYKDLATNIYRKALDAITDFERQLGKQGILGCGFGAGASTFQATCAKYGLHISLETAQLVVDTYRTTYASVPRLWRTLEKAIKGAIQGTPHAVGPLKIAADHEQLVIVLPSGRKLRYQQPRIDEDDKVCFWREDPKTKQWVEHRTWGGFFTENVVQAIANDLQRVAGLRLEEEFFDVVLGSHDEWVAEDDEKRLPKYQSIMELRDNPPEWVSLMGIPIKVDAKATKVYRK